MTKDIFDRHEATNSEPPVFGVDWTCAAHGDACEKSGMDWDCTDEPDYTPAWSPLPLRRLTVEPEGV